MPLKSSVVRALASLKQEEGRTKRVAKKCFKLLRYRAFSAHIFSAPEWPGERSESILSVLLAANLVE